MNYAQNTIWYRQKLAALAALLLLTVCGGLAADGRTYNSDSSIDTSHPDWMQWLSDDVYISELSIPGTHHSLMDEGSDFVERHGLTLNQQLQAGIRAVQIQIDYRGNNVFIARKQGGDSPESFSLILDQLGDFLDAHPAETILMSLQIYVPNYVTEKTVGEWIDRYKVVFDNYRDTHLHGEKLWMPAPGTCEEGSVNDPTIISDTPKLGELRGKILVLNQSRLGCRGFPWPQIEVQNEDSVGTIWDIENKWDRVRQHLDTADDNSDPTQLYVNFLDGQQGGELLMEFCIGAATSGVAISASTGAVVLQNPYLFGVLAAGCVFSATVQAYPYAVAGGSELIRGVNDFALDYLLAGNVESRTGVLMMNFPGEGMIDAIIAHNFRFMRDLNQDGSIDEVASEFPFILNNIAYNGREVGGSRQALDRNKLIGRFTSHVMPGISGFEDNVPRMDTIFNEFTFIDDPCSIFDWVLGFFVINPTCTETDVGYAVTDAGLFRETDWINTDNIFETRSYKSVSFNVGIGAYYVLPPQVMDNLPGFVAPRCGPLPASNAGAAILRDALIAEFPGYDWNVLVKDGDGSFDNWAYNASADNKYDTGGGQHRCVVWGYLQEALPPLPNNARPAFTSPYELENAVSGSGNFLWFVQATDPEGDPLTITGVDIPEWMEMASGPTAALAPISGPPPGGNHYVTLRVSDGLSLPVIQEFFIKVNLEPAFLFQDGSRVPDITQITPVELEIVDTNPLVQTWEVRAVDDNGDALIISEKTEFCGVPGLPDWVTVQDRGDGTAALIGFGPVEGLYKFCMSVTDGELESSDEFWLNVTVNESPVFDSASSPASQVMRTTAMAGSAADTVDVDSIVVPLIARLDGSFNWDVQATDIENQNLTIEVLEKPEWLSFQDNGDGSVLLSANTPVYGRHPVVLQVSDGISSPTAQFFSLLVQVNNASDGEAGSLRDALASLDPGQELSFHPNFSGQVVTLDQGPLVIDKDVNLSGKFLPNGITLSGSGTSPVFRVDSGRLSLSDLTVADGYSASSGGCIVNGGILSLKGVTMTGCRSDQLGGAIWSTSGEVTILNSTLTGNEALFTGGAINSNGVLVIRHSTIVDNHVRDPSGRGGGLDNSSGAELRIENSIVARNTAASAADISKGSGTVIPSGVSFIGDNSSVTAEYPEGPLVGTASAPADPMLAVLDDYGGPTWTMHPLKGSLVVDTALFIEASTPAFDQRGMPRPDGTSENPDLGAVELIEDPRDIFIDGFESEPQP